MLRRGADGWQPRALIASALESRGVAEVWHGILEHRALLEASGRLDARRRDQARAWLWKLIEEGLARSFRDRPGMAEAIAREEAAVADQTRTPTAAARELLERFFSPNR